MRRYQLINESSDQYKSDASDMTVAQAIDALKQVQYMFKTLTSEGLIGTRWGTEINNSFNTLIQRYTALQEMESKSNSTTNTASTTGTTTTSAQNTQALSNNTSTQTTV